MKMVYTLPERIEMIYLYAQQDYCFRRTVTVYNELHPDKNVSHEYIRQLVAKFEETGSVKNKKRTTPRLLDEAAEVEILGEFTINPQLSLRQAARNTGVSHESVRKVLKKHNFFPYKLQVVQELGDDDPDKRIEFCELMTNLIAREPNTTKNICFSDECSFFLNGRVNKQNCRYWDNENPHLYREGHTQTPEKVNVWAAMYGDTVIGPIFIDGNLDGETYLSLLENTIDPLIVEQLENQRDAAGNPALSEDLLRFQQDGAPPHYYAPVRQWLDQHYTDRWIGRRGAIEWPPRSPDLTPLDFFLWGYLKSVVYKTEPTSIEELRDRIRQGCRSISRETFTNVRDAFESRLYFCLANNGNHFEHLI